MEQKLRRTFKIVEAFIGYLDWALALLLVYGGIFGVVYLVFISVEYVSGTMQSHLLSTVTIVILLMVMFSLAQNSKKLETIAEQVDAIRSHLKEDVEKQLHWEEDDTFANKVLENLEHLTEQKEAIARIEQQLESIGDERIAKSVLDDLERLSMQVRRISAQLDERARLDFGKQT